MPGNWRKYPSRKEQPQVPAPPPGPEPQQPQEEGGAWEPWDVVYSTFHKSPDGSAKWLKILVTPEGNYVLKIGESDRDENKVQISISLSEEERARLSLVLQQADLIKELKRIKSLLGELKG